jgi:hypothetical protein
MPNPLLDKLQQIGPLAGGSGPKILRLFADDCITIALHVIVDWPAIERGLAAIIAAGGSAAGAPFARSPSATAAGSATAPGLPAASPATAPPAPTSSSTPSTPSFPGCILSFDVRVGFRVGVRVSVCLAPFNAY